MSAASVSESIAADMKWPCSGAATPSADRCSLLGEDIQGEQVFFGKPAVLPRAD